MKKIKSMLFFIIILLIILLFDFLIYKNTDILIPKDEKKLFTYSNSDDSNKENDGKDFLYRLYEQIEIKNDYRKISNQELENVYNNKILNNLILSYIYKIDSNQAKYLEKIQSDLYVGNLTNTIYGDLKVLSIRDTYYEVPNNLIVYSEDMTKIYYFDGLYYDTSYLYGRNEEYNAQAQGDTSIYDKQIEEETNASKGNEQNRAKVLEKINKAFSDAVINTEFVPDTIVYKLNYYLVKDTTRDITVYYDQNNDVIFGLYKEFDK